MACIAQSRIHWQEEKMVTAYKMLHKVKHGEVLDAAERWRIANSMHGPDAPESARGHGH